jgi:hypothetical protein
MTEREYLCRRKGLAEINVQQGFEKVALPLGVPESRRRALVNKAVLKSSGIPYVFGIFQLGGLGGVRSTPACRQGVPWQVSDCLGANRPGRSWMCSGLSKLERGTAVPAPLCPTDIGEQWTTLRREHEVE